MNKTESPKKIGKDFELVIYVGTHKISAFAGNFEPTGPKILSYKEAFQPKGFENGLVVNLEAAVNTIDDLIDELLPARGLREVNASVVLANSKLESYTFSSSQYYESQRSITENDVRAVIEQTRSVATLPLSQYVLQIIPESFLVNDIANIRDPLGLEASRLGVNLQIFTMNYQEFKNINKVFEATDIVVNGYWPRMLTVSEALLTEKEKESESILVDVADHMTTLVVWKNGGLQATHMIPIGGKDLSESISQEWGIQLQDAQNVKERFGTLEKSTQFGEELIPLIQRNGKDNHQVKRQEFQEKFLKHAEKWLQEIVGEVHSLANAQNMSYPHYVFSGGGVAFDGFLEFLNDRFGIEARTGYCKYIDAPQETLVDPSLTPALGMFQWLHHNAKIYGRLVSPRGVFEKTFTSAKEWFYSYF